MFCTPRTTTLNRLLTMLSKINSRTQRKKSSLFVCNTQLVLAKAGKYIKSLFHDLSVIAIEFGLNRSKKNPPFTVK